MLIEQINNSDLAESLSVIESNTAGLNLETTQQQVLSALASLKTYTDGIEALLAAINSDTTTENTNLASVIAALNTMLGYIDQLEQYTDGLEGLLTTSNTLLTNIGNNTDTLESLASTLNTYVDGLESLVGSTNVALAAVNSSLNTIQGYTDGIEGLIGSTNSALATLNGLVSALNGYVDGVESLLAHLTDGTQKTQLVDAGGVNQGTLGNPLRVDPTGATTQPVSAASLPLPAGAMTEATGQAILAEMRDDTFTNSFLWEDIGVNPSIFYREDRVKSQDDGTVTVVYTRLSDTTIVGSLPATAVPVASLSDRHIEFFRWYTIIASTGIAVGDWLTNTVIINSSTGAVLSSTWYNLTQQSAISAPSYANIRDPEYDNALDSTVQATNTKLDTLNTNFGAKADAIATDSTSSWSAISLLKWIGQGVLNIYARLADGSQKTQLVDNSDVNLGTSSNPVYTAGGVPVDSFPASQNITTRDIASVTATGEKGQVFTIGTPTAGSAATFVISGIESVNIMTLGLWTGTLIVEASVDGGTTWHNKFSRLPGTAYSGLTSFNSDCLLIANVSGCNRVRIRSTAAMTGTAQVTITESINSHVFDVLNPIRLLDALTNTLMTIKAASVEPVITDTAIVVTQREKAQRSSATSNPVVLSTEQEVLVNTIITRLSTIIAMDFPQNSVSAAGADGISNTLDQPADLANNPLMQTMFNMMFNGTTWDRMRGDALKNLLVSYYSSAPASANILNGSATSAATIITVPANKTWKGHVYVSGSRRTAAALAVAAADCTVKITWTPGTGGTAAYTPIQADFSTPGQALTVVTGTASSAPGQSKYIEIYAGTTGGTLALAETNCDQFFGSCDGYIV